MFTIMHSPYDVFGEYAAYTAYEAMPLLILSFHLGDIDSLLQRFYFLQFPYLEDSQY